MDPATLKMLRGTHNDVGPLVPSLLKKGQGGRPTPSHLKAEIDAKVNC
jgi:hypothetical protein